MAATMKMASSPNGSSAHALGRRYEEESETTPMAVLLIAMGLPFCTAFVLKMGTMKEEVVQQGFLPDGSTIGRMPLRVSSKHRLGSPPGRLVTN